MPELKPCPFCGGRAIYKNTLNTSAHQGVGFSYEIKCERCKIKIPNTFKTEFSLDDNGEIITRSDERAQAAELWNRREV